MGKKEMKRDHRERRKNEKNKGEGSLMAGYRVRRESVRCLCGPKLKHKNTLVPQAWVKFAHSLNM